VNSETCVLGCKSFLAANITLMERFMMGILQALCFMRNILTRSISPLQALECTSNQ
jgi:hypothetical protein